MSYQAISDLAQDPPFSRRVAACLSVEAQGQTDHLASLCLLNPTYGAGYFMPFVSSAPGFGDAYAAGGSDAIDDAMVLSAVQATWPAVSALYPPPASP